MGTVILDTSMSLDGFMTADNRTAEVPLGEDGELLRQWAIDDEAGVELLGRWVGNLGASIAGRVTYDTSLPWWGPNGPSGDARRPLFVVTHQAPQDTFENGVYSFVTDGIDGALARAQAAAGGLGRRGDGRRGRRPAIPSRRPDRRGADPPRAGGAGGATPMFDDVGRLDLTTLEAVCSDRATDLRYRIERR